MWRLRRLHKGPLPVWGDPECVPRRLRCIPAWGGAPSPMAPKPRRYTLRKLPNSHSTPLQPQGRHTPSRPQAPLIVPSFPFLLVRYASSLHIILSPPLLLAAFYLLLCAYFFAAAQPYNPHSYIYRHIFAVVWQTQHTWRCNLSSNLRRADFHSGAYTSTICMTLVYLQV